MPPPLGFGCVCGKEYSSHQGLSQHQRRYCKGRPENDDDRKCNMCDRLFDTYNGLRLHMKRTHKEDYNSDLQVEARGPSRFWTVDEIAELARAEAQYEGENLIEHLRTISSRSVDAIRGRRKMATYKEKVEEIRAELVEAQERNRAAPTHEREMENRSEHLNARLLEEIMMIERNELSDGARQLRDDILTLSIAEARNKIDEWIEQRVPASRRAAPRVDRVTQTYKRFAQRIGEERNNRKRRALQFRLAQYRYKYDRRAYANDLLDDNEHTLSEIRPNQEDIQTSYLEIFGTESKTDDETINVDGREYIEISYPISNEEIVKALKDMDSKSAAGPDGLSLKKLRKFKTAELRLLLNAMLLLEYTPTALKKSRTTLIPKSNDDRGNVANWRPITVSSVIARLMGRILAQRTQLVHLHHSQRGFQSIDGCFANVAILENLIKYKRKKGQPVCLISLDLQKAFDRVSHHSIIRALRRLNVDNKFMNFIKNTYDGSTTSIKCGDIVTEPMNVRRGVKQGDPLSPFLFNAVMDELLQILHQRSGVNIVDDVKLCAMAYADDLVLVSGTPEDGRRMLDESVVFFQKRGLAINVDKSRALIMRTVPSKKKLCVITEPTFKVGDTWIPQVKIHEELKYLGQKFTSDGMTRCSTNMLHEQLSRVLRSPTKPQQKLEIVKTYLIPRYIASLQGPNMPKWYLLRVDQQIRTALKKILHLPTHCSNYVFYAPMKLGGLGIFNFASMIPAIGLKRVTSLIEIDEQVKAAFDIMPDWKRRLTQMVGEMDTTEKIKIEYGRKLDLSFSGNGLNQTANHPACSDVLRNPPVYWSGEEFVKAVHLRLNLLPSKGVPYNSQQERRCRAGCWKVESLSHILQNCPITHWQRIHRHNYIQARLTTAAKKHGWKATTEPHIRCTDGMLKKPDVIFEKENKVIVADVAVHWEGSIPLAQQYQNKVAYYGAEPFTEEMKRRYPGKSIYVLPLIVGARGTWCKQNNSLIKQLNIANYDIRDLITTTMRGGWILHSSFMSMVWQDR